MKHYVAINCFANVSIHDSLLILRFHVITEGSHLQPTGQTPAQSHDTITISGEVNTFKQLTTDIILFSFYSLIDYSSM